MGRSRLCTRRARAPGRLPYTPIAIIAVGGTLTVATGAAHWARTGQVGDFSSWAWPGIFAVDILALRPGRGAQQRGQDVIDACGLSAAARRAAGRHRRPGRKH